MVIMPSAMFVNRKGPVLLLQTGITTYTNAFLRHPECINIFHLPLTHHFLSRGYVSYRQSNMTVRAKQADIQNHRYLNKPHS